MLEIKLNKEKSGENEIIYEVIENGEIKGQCFAVFDKYEIIINKVITDDYFDGLVRAVLNYALISKGVNNCKFSAELAVCAEKHGFTEIDSIDGFFRNKNCK